MHTGPESVLDKVREIVAEFQGVDPGRISLESDLARDFGIAGDDGVDLFGEFDSQFEVDWSGLDLGVHFGNEGWGPPPPWLLKNNCLLYEPQPCKVSDIVAAVDSGRWQGTKLSPRPLAERVKWYVASTLLWTLLAGMSVGIISLLLSR